MGGKCTPCGASSEVRSIMEHRTCHPLGAGSYGSQLDGDIRSSRHLRHRSQSDGDRLRYGHLRQPSECGCEKDRR
jgi:hypothetical protein